MHLLESEKIIHLVIQLVIRDSYDSYENGPR